MICNKLNITNGFNRTWDNYEYDIKIQLTSPRLMQ